MKAFLYLNSPLQIFLFFSSHKGMTESTLQGFILALSFSFDTTKVRLLFELNYRFFPIIFLFTFFNAKNLNRYYIDSTFASSY